ncbi:XdhC family protein [bacterium]|nr:XdhC family protein [bacterium]
MEIHEQLAKLQEDGVLCALATVVKIEGSTPQVVGAKMIVTADKKIYGTVGGGALEAEVIDKAVDAMRKMEPALVSFDFSGSDVEIGEMLCGGKMEVFIEPVSIKPSLYIFGAGHIGFALSKMAVLCGFKVIIADDREDMVTRERFPEADDIHCGDFIQIANELKFPAIAYIVIVTHGHKFDQDVLNICINKSYKYLGMIGSRKKVSVIFNNLLDKGIPQEKINEVHSPIGLNIGGQSPGEIAVSILSEILAVKYGKLDDVRQMKEFK